MKKIILTLLALVGTMSMNAQVIEVMKNGEVVATFTADQADEVVFKEETTGTEKRTGGVSVNWVQLWENGPKFAEYNVGATSATEYGGYYTWGGAYNNNPNLEGFEWTDDHNEGTDALSGDNDTATNLWGSKWRMPTQAELKALLANCDVEWTKDYKGDKTNIKGRIFTGKGDYKDNSVFLPAAGSCSDGDVSGQGIIGIYWSSTPNGMYNAYYLGFDSNGQSVTDSYREIGRSVRAVLNEVVE